MPHYRNRSDRRRAQPGAPAQVAPILTYLLTVAGAVATLTFNDEVIMSGTVAANFPSQAGITGPAVVSSAQTGPTTITVTFAAAVDAINRTFWLDQNQVQIRGVSGGWVSAAPRFFAAS